MLDIRNLTITQGPNALIAGLNLQVEPGDIATVTGASGSGKSTLLNWLVGDLDPAFQASGELWLAGQRRDQLAVEARGVGILFQDDLLFPHLSVGQNLAFALPAALQGAAARRARVEQTLREIGLDGFHDRDPATLSGGQRARVSLMRALLAEPCALLLDEPFSRLDAELRAQFRGFVFEQIARQRIPTLLVTHDPDDVPPGGRVLDIHHWQA
ncbi:MAG TPA: ABC transporter ATP-binding protein [Hydrogenophaga sp.]|uniref:ATP-binding cassette domain-containing protein n=1 Tax=Hydrogenophaga sp. TaxID=1904254 RepID=UPI0008CF17F7|nr:ATP-binding cassette domain-containing protein [Hydrogenophaga sp.]OGA75141.1 MAG: ABC transporter ATP-binding protein [Burkholderiales bacterium GWE1_65_30]OGA93276.1 MAG: ABC transporter ATP-binding protein [Burkholderiales bacterium GWF1_66_17]HAX20902.1 ABC transporter ATP-binding protein [Hydrogenophaga sp.]HBU17374.1 ABC transporter ATP-binding protein [Hydrogenophaga sp.]